MDLGALAQALSSGLGGYQQGRNEALARQLKMLEEQREQKSDLASQQYMAAMTRNMDSSTEANKPLKAAQQLNYESLAEDREWDTVLDKHGMKDISPNARAELGSPDYGVDWSTTKTFEKTFANVLAGLHGKTGQPLAKPWVPEWKKMALLDEQQGYKAQETIAKFLERLIRDIESGKTTNDPQQIAKQWYSHPLVARAKMPLPQSLMNVKPSPLAELMRRKTEHAMTNADEALKLKRKAQTLLTNYRNVSLNLQKQRIELERTRTSFLLPTAQLAAEAFASKAESSLDDSLDTVIGLQKIIDDFQTDKTGVVIDPDDMEPGQWTQYGEYMTTLGLAKQIANEKMMRAQAAKDNALILKAQAKGNPVLKQKLAQAQSMGAKPSEIAADLRALGWK